MAVGPMLMLSPNRKSQHAVQNFFDKAFSSSGNPHTIGGAIATPFEDLDIAANAPTFKSSHQPSKPAT